MCVLTQGFTLDCKDKVGGLKAIYVVEFSAINAYTLASGEITALTLDTPKAFFKYELPKGVSSMTWTVQSNPDNGTTFYESAVVVKLRGLSTAKRNELKLLAAAPLLVIARDNNDVYWLHGYISGCDLTAGTANSGTAMGDAYGMDMTILHREADLPAKLQASVVTSLALT
jgi:hypothetical protein